MSTITVSNQHFTTIPKDGNRLPKEMSVYELLNKLKTTFLCEIAEGKIYEGKYDKVLSVLPIFKIISVYESEVE